MTTQNFRKDLLKTYSIISKNMFWVKLHYILRILRLKYVRYARFDDTESYPKALLTICQSLMTLAFILNEMVPWPELYKGLY